MVGAGQVVEISYSFSRMSLSDFFMHGTRVAGQNS